MQIVGVRDGADRGAPPGERPNGSRVETVDRQPTRVRVLIVDENGLFSLGLASLLGAQSSVDVVGRATRGQDAVRLAGELRPDVVLMGVGVRDGFGVAATRAIVERNPGARVVILTAESDDADMVRAIAAGARGVLPSHAPIAAIVGAIGAVSTGGMWLSPRAAEVAFSHLRAATASTAAADLHAMAGLSAREREVLRLLGRGMGNAEIAGVLQISPHTAKNHVSRILEKLGLPNRIQLATYAVRMSLA